MGSYPSKPIRKPGKHPSLTLLGQNIDLPAAVVTINQDIAFLVCAEVRAHDFPSSKLAYSSTALQQRSETRFSFSRTDLQAVECSRNAMAIPLTHP